MVSAAVLTPVALAAWWFGGVAWQVLLGLAAAALVFEWTGLCQYRPAWRGMTYMAAGLAWAAVSPFLWQGTSPAVELGAAAVAIWVVSQRLDLAGGLIYAGAGLLSLLWLRQDPVAGQANVLFVLLIVWATDIGAYLAGRLIGGARLAPAISPGKTWSGAAGGLVAGVVAGVAVAGGAGVQAIAVAALLSVVSQAGDLLESALKRFFKVKDSGGLIPGHGGVLDRVDGLLAAAPVAMGLAYLLGHGVALWQ